jgi:hypothetical protein
MGYKRISGADLAYDVVVKHGRATHFVIGECHDGARIVLAEVRGKIEAEVLQFTFGQCEGYRKIIVEKIIEEVR